MTDTASRTASTIVAGLSAADVDRLTICVSDVTVPQAGPILRVRTLFLPDGHLVPKVAEDWPEELPLCCTVVSTTVAEGVRDVVARYDDLSAATGGHDEIVAALHAGEDVPGV